MRNAGFANGKPAVLVVIFKQPGANVITTTDDIKAALPQLQADIPPGMDMTIMVDRTRTIRASLFDVEVTLLIAMLLVILVTYLFLGNVRAMLIPGLALPLSLLGTFAVMALLGYSLDNLSLMALTISTGFVVDDAVVVLENIIRHLELGKKPRLAALAGAKEVVFTVISMSVSLIAVFIPILLMGGLVGRLFREFAITLSVAILISMVVSLTVTPMMCAQMLRSQAKPVSGYLHRFGSRVHLYYQHSLAWSLKHVKSMLFLTLLSVLITVSLFGIVPKGFFPQQDIGQLNGIIQIDQNMSFQALKIKFEQLLQIVLQDPAVEKVLGFIGGTNRTTPGTIFITLKPLEQRGASADEVLNRLRPKLAQVSGASLFLQAAQDLVIEGRQANAQFQYTLSGDNLHELNHWASLVTEKISKLPGIADVNSDLHNRGLQVFIQIDRDTASRFGITAAQIDNTLYSAFGQS